MRAAKTRAAERGERLKELFTRALARELGLPTGRREGTPVRLPLVGRDAEPRIDVTNVDIEAALGTEEAQRYTER